MANFPTTIIIKYYYRESLFLTYGNGSFSCNYSILMLFSCFIKRNPWDILSVGLRLTVVMILYKQYNSRFNHQLFKCSLNHNPYKQTTISSSGKILMVGPLPTKLISGLMECFHRSLSGQHARCRVDRAAG